ncbi:MAG: hypothetical protein K2O44_01775 [Clostridia bacterium]|nr:hypothetical protein [Clostridia bacterium]
MYNEYSEFERIRTRTDVDGCGGDCDNCDCRSACSSARTAPDEYGGDDE